MTTKIASLGIPGDVIMSAGAGLDFSADSKGVFKGIEAVTFRLNTDITNSDSPLGGTGSEWTIVDDITNADPLGAAWSAANEANGVFTFPSTGYYLVLVSMQAYNASAADTACYLEAQTEIGGAYATIGQITQSLHAAAAWNYGTIPILLKVTDVAHKFKANFVVGNAATRCMGGAFSRTEYTFIKLADI